MTAAPNENWIESSLARLETLEAQREELAASGQTERLTEIDEEIRGLYEALEAVAGDDDEQAPANEAQPAAVAAVAAVPAAPAASAEPFGAPMDSPVMMDDDFDAKPSGSKLPLILGAAAVVAIGVGGFMMLGGEKEAPKPKDPGPAVVIQAGQVVEDTQEPVVAKGADGDRTRGTNFKEGSKGASRPTGRRTQSGSRPSKSRTDNQDDGRKFKFEKGKDPLAGVD